MKVTHSDNSNLIYPKGNIQDVTSSNNEVNSTSSSSNDEDGAELKVENKPDISKMVPKIVSIVGIHAGVEASLNVQKVNSISKESPNKGEVDDEIPSTYVGIVLTETVIQCNDETVRNNNQGSPFQDSIIVSADQEGKQAVLGLSTPFKLFLLRTPSYTISLK